MMWLKKVIQKFKKNKIEVQVRSIFHQGILLTSPRQKHNIPRDLIHFTRQFRSMCRTKKINPVAAAYSHVAKQSKIIKIIFGASNLKELNEFIKAAKSNKKKILLKPPVWKNSFLPNNWKKT